MNPRTHNILIDIRQTTNAFIHFCPSRPLLYTDHLYRSFEAKQNLQHKFIFLRQKT